MECFEASGVIGRELGRRNFLANDFFVPACKTSFGCLARGMHSSLPLDRSKNDSMRNFGACFRAQVCVAKVKSGNGEVRMRRNHLGGVNCFAYGMNGSRQSAWFVSDVGKWEGLVSFGVCDLSSLFGLPVCSC